MILKRGAINMQPELAHVAIAHVAHIREHLNELDGRMRLEGGDNQLLATIRRAFNQHLLHKLRASEQNLQERQTQLKKAYHQIDELREALERARGNSSVPDSTILKDPTKRVYRKSRPPQPPKRVARNINTPL